MSQLVCPLCGRFVSLGGFDPSGFEPDIFAANVRGLGRGRGWAVSEMFSVLDEPAITGPIAERCRIILGLIEGGEVLSAREASALRAEVERRRAEAVRERRAREDLHAELAELEGQVAYYRGEARTLRRALEDRSAELAHLEDEVTRLRRAASRLRAEVERLESELDELEDEDEEEMLAVEEMQEMLDRINESANADFECLSDAVDFLLEGG